MSQPSLHSLLVFAPDLSLARRFYEQILGLTVTAETPEHLELQGSDFRLVIFSCETSSSPEGYSTRAGSSIAFGVADVESEAARLRGLGVTVLHDEAADGPVGRYVAFTDPFGTVHELVETR